MPNNLQDMFGMTGNLSSVMDEQDLDAQRNAMKAYGQLQDLYQAEEMNPLKVQQQGLLNEQYKAQIPGIAARSKMQQQEADIANATYWDRLSDAQKEHALTASDNDLKLLKSAAMQKIFSNNPEERKQGQDFMNLWNSITEKMALQKQKDETSLAVQQLRNQRPAGRGAGGKGGKAGGDPKTLQAALIQAINSGDTEKAQFYQAQLTALKEANGKQQADLTQYGVKTAPKPQAPAIPGTKPKDPYAGFSITQKK